MIFGRLLSVGICIAFISSTLYAEQNPLETKIKAAYLYNFTKFVTWPDRQGKPIQICVSGDTQITKVLDELSAKQNGSFSVIAGSKINPTECQILYISGSDRDVDIALHETKDQNILTVSDNLHFSNYGGMITLFSENGKIRFEINLPSVQKTNLKISSKLLELAKTR